MSQSVDSRIFYFFICDVICDKLGAYNVGRLYTLRV